MTNRTTISDIMHTIEDRYIDKSKNKSVFGDSVLDGSLDDPLDESFGNPLEESKKQQFAADTCKNSAKHGITRSYINQEIHRYLEQGNRIKRIETDDISFKKEHKDTKTTYFLSEEEIEEIQKNANIDRDKLRKERVRLAELKIKEKKERLEKEILDLKKKKLVKERKKKENLDLKKKKLEKERKKKEILDLKKKKLEKELLEKKKEREKKRLLEGALLIKIKKECDQKEYKNDKEKLEENKRKKLEFLLQRGYVSLKEIKQMTNMSRHTITRRKKEFSFPKSTANCYGIVMYDKIDILQWMEDNPKALIKKKNQHG